MSDEDLADQKTPAGDGLPPAQAPDEVKPQASDAPADDPLPSAGAPASTAA